MAKVYVFLANGFEDVEALIPIDVLRRGNVEVITVSTTDTDIVESAHGVGIRADVMFDDCDFADADLLMLPGGMPGASNLFAHEGVCKALLSQQEQGKKIAAICASPAVVLAQLGILPAAAFPYAYTILADLVDEQTASQIAEGMRFKHLMEA